MDSSSFANDNVVYYWGIINVALHLPYFFWYFIKRYRKNKSEIQTLS
ncbi:MAG: hypothetical protein PF487_11055 [Bacteroidales bacterium]|nr:hypothetical protein [Bacteroidales bacterium]